MWHKMQIGTKTLTNAIHCSATCCYLLSKLQLWSRSALISTAEHANQEIDSYNFEKLKTAINTSPT